ncbi:MAG: L-dehydroascorbate transporter large permease subunit [candidate division NC10 bacterium RIFCSPLOWO2_12_FULL_66_18]|nr:MAG: L-dehydroascorbate transporter large permease subunit [candidate division NC10 bacterium RIFCSPLOWO2_02_FULL_66_22]OGB95989.1 MAG: L-dehydroascorbate transporter large permease subunit [candidate division NC10 bacterium RIFCSPLOWO2_12_FULL_66_18]
MTLLIFFGVFFVTLVLSAPIVFSLALSALALLWNKGVLVPQLVVQRMFAGIDSFPMMAIPFFMLAGALMHTGGISTRLVRFSNYLVGWIQGGLAHVAILASMFFAGITGSAVADATAIGSTLIPLMNKRGFPTLFSASVVAAAGVVGPIIPPSIPMVIYGVMAGVSIGALFMGGIIPGILIGLGLMVVAYVKAKRHGYPREAVRPTAREFLQATVSAFGAILMPLIILGGIFGGIFTATEAAAVATVYAFLMGKFVYRELQWSHLPEILYRAGLNTAMILIIVGVANLVGYIMAVERIPLMVAELFLGITTNKYVMLLLINILLLIVGCFIDGASALIIFTPVLLPIIYKLGIDPIFFGVMMTVNLMIGTITPPVGLCLYVACGIADVRLDQISRTIIPFLLIEIAVLFLITYVPGLIMFLPALFGPK